MSTRWKSNSSLSSLGDPTEQDPLLPIKGRQQHTGHDASHQHNQSVHGDELATTRKTRNEAIILALKSIRTRYREYLAEFLGTMILVLLLCGVSAEQSLKLDPTKSALTSAVGAGLAILLGICVSGHISGGHINPAVTVAMAAYNGFPLRKVPGYILSQVLGAFTGAALLYSIIEPAISEFDQGQRHVSGELGTAGIFGTFPPLYVGIPTAIASEIIGTGVFIILILASGHQGNGVYLSGQPVIIALSILALGLCLGFTSGFSLNPARDLGPRFFSAIAGWGFGVFSANNYYCFVPMFAPILGGLIGGLVYTIFVD